MNLLLHENSNNLWTLTARFYLIHTSYCVQRMCAAALRSSLQSS